MSRIRIELIPGLLAVGVFIAWAAAEGGFDVTSSAPGALFLLGLLAGVTVAYRGRLRSLPTASRVALAFLAAFVVWNFASIAWADVQGVAWDGANRNLIYLVVYALFSIVTLRPGSAAIVLGTYSIGIAAVGVITMLSAIGTADPGLSFVSGRLAEPTGYPNAVSALFIGGIWPAAYLASRREVPWAARGLMLATAGLLAQLALLPQSRGAMIVFPIALIVYLAVTPNRLRAFFVVAIAGIATALAAPPVFDVFTIGDHGGDLGAALVAARDAMLVSFVALLVVGTALALADRGIEIPERVSRSAGRVAGVLAGAAAIVALVVALAAIGNPVDWAGDRWDDFKGGYDSAGFGDSRFSGDLGSNRYDFWRVGLAEEFAAAPLTGDGSDNFEVAYLQHRESHEEPLYPHSLPVRILAGTGLVGGLLFGAFLVAAVVAAVRTRVRTGSRFTGGLVAIALASATYFFVHSSGDWLWSFPALAAPAIAWLGMVSGITRDVEAEAGDAFPEPRSSAPVVGAKVAIGVVVGLVAIATIGMPWIAARDVKFATSNWPSDPEAAFERLDRARSLNFLSAQPDLTAGAIASQRNDVDGVERHFQRALERDPTNWYARLELATAEALKGRDAAALEDLRIGLKLNPEEQLLRQALERVRRDSPMTLAEIDRRLLARVCSVVGKTDVTPQCE